MRREEFISQVDRAAYADATERMTILRRLARDADQALTYITTEYHYMGRWNELFTVLTLIGYPGVDAALPWIVEHIERNSSASAALLDLLRSLPPSALVPHIVMRMLAPDHNSSWGYEVENLCDALQHLAPDYTVPCLPALVYLLALNLDPTILDPGFLIDTIASTQRTGVAFAAPALLMTMRTAPWPVSVEAAHRLFTSLPVETQRLYRLVPGYPDE